jgi:hypothetical protein
MSAMYPVALPGSAEKKQESRDAQKVLRLLSKELRSIGFERTKPTFFTRSGRFVLEFVHVHKFTFGPSFRVHLGIRVRSDEFAAAALNGPHSDAILDPATSSPYRFSFSTSPADLALCSSAMATFVVTEGLPWLSAVDDLAKLLQPGPSPLAASAIAALAREVENPTVAVASAATREALNAA